MPYILLIEFKKTKLIINLYVDLFVFLILGFGLGVLVVIKTRIVEN